MNAFNMTNNEVNRIVSNEQKEAVEALQASYVNRPNPFEISKEESAKIYAKHEELVKACFDTKAFTSKYDARTTWSFEALI